MQSWEQINFPIKMPFRTGLPWRRDGPRQPFVFDGFSYRGMFTRIPLAEYDSLGSMRISEKKKDCYSSLVAMGNMCCVIENQGIRRNKFSKQRFKAPMRGDWNTVVSLLERKKNTIARTRLWIECINSAAAYFTLYVGYECKIGFGASVNQQFWTVS